MLTDNQIRRLIQDDVVNITPSPEENQFQPASLDVCIGLVEVFDDETIYKNQLEYFRRFSEGPEEGQSDEDFASLINDFLDGFPINIRSFEEDGSFILEPGQQAVIYSLEQFEIPDWFSIHLELRSSNGRRGSSPTDGYIQNLLYEGRVRMSVVNKNPNPLKFYRGDRFAQLFFEIEDNLSYIPNNLLGRAYSSVHTKMPLKYKPSFDKLGINTGIVRNLHNSQIMNEEGINYLIDEGLLEVSPGAVIENDHLVFTCSDTALSFKKNFGTIDTQVKYDDNVLYDEIDLSKGYILKGDDLLVVKLEQYLKLSNHVGILLKLSHPLNDNYQHKDEAHSYSVNDNYLFNHKVGAGWIDPGYEGQVTMHDWTNLINLLREGDVVMTGTVYYFPEPVGNSYGSGKLGSHYVNNSITASV